MSLDSKVNSVFVKVYDCVILHSKGENDIDQLCCVLRVLGTPNETIWPVSCKQVDRWSLWYHVCMCMGL